MSILWLIRLILTVALYCYLFFSKKILRNRTKYHKILENGLLNIVFVALYNALCYLPVIIRSDADVLIKPTILKTTLVTKWYSVLGQIFIISSILLLLYSITKRKAIGAQDTAGKLLSKGIYAFCRHPIYLGIVFVAMGFAIVRVNFDGMIVFPLIFIANILQAMIEEQYDVGIRFKKEYTEYKKRTAMFGPVWFWGLIVILLVLPIIITWAA